VAVSALAPCKTVDMLRDNMAIAAAMVKAAAGVGLGQVVNISSDTVYADSAEPLTERSVTAPETLHGVTHLAREVMFRSDI
jgi:UDP-glucose 4-epimerase